MQLRELAFPIGDYLRKFPNTSCIKARYLGVHGAMAALYACHLNHDNDRKERPDIFMVYSHDGGVQPKFWATEDLSEAINQYKKVSKWKEL